MSSVKEDTHLHIDCWWSLMFCMLGMLWECLYTLGSRYCKVEDYCSHWHIHLEQQSHIIAIHLYLLTSNTPDHIPNTISNFIDYISKSHHLLRSLYLMSNFDNAYLLNSCIICIVYYYSLWNKIMGNSRQSIFLSIQAKRLYWYSLV